MSRFDELYDVVMEANAYNKLANNLKDEYDRERKKRDSYRRRLRNLSPDNLLINKADYNTNKVDYTNKANYHDTKMHVADTAYYNQIGGNIQDYCPHGNRFGTCEDYRIARKKKKEWMKNHGNVGKSPEERYKEGRYLDQQKELKGIKESVDDIRLEIYESCRYGDISEEERDLLLEMI
jgi:hypothetical protein